MDVLLETLRESLRELQRLTHTALLWAAPDELTRGDFSDPESHVWPALDTDAKTLLGDGRLSQLQEGCASFTASLAHLLDTDRFSAAFQQVLRWSACELEALTCALDEAIRIAGRGSLADRDPAFRQSHDPMPLDELYFDLRDAARQTQRAKEVLEVVLLEWLASSGGPSATPG